MSRAFLSFLRTFYSMLLFLIFLQAEASTCLGADLSFVGTGAYNISGNTVVLTADEVVNNDFWGYSGSIRLELWAFSVPYPGTTIGYKLASSVLGQLSAGYYYYNINSGAIPFTTPSPGSWYFSLQVREYVGGLGDGYITRDYLNFSTPVRVAGGANWGDVRIVGATSWQIVGSSVNLSVQQVNNICDLGTSGSLRLDLWATASPYNGSDVITGYRVASVSLNPLVGGFAYNNITQTPAFTKPPDGGYYATLTLSEYHNGSYMMTDYVNYPDFYRVGNPPSAPTAKAATSITSTGFTANWSSVTGAIGYRIDVSPSSGFNSYVSGYQDLDVGAMTSLGVNTLNGSTSYYYRVRAYNVVGASGSSGTISATTLPSPPPPPIANAVTGVTTSALTANWSIVTGASGYRLDASSSSDFTSFLAGYQNLNVGTVTSKSISGLSPGTAYYYRVRAYNGGGTSDNSATIATVTVPPAPTANAASAVTSDRFTANWSTASGATGYRLDVSTSSTFSTYVAGYQNLELGSAPSQTVSALRANTRYYYRVRAYNGSGTSANSGAITVTTTSMPTVPPILSYSRQESKLVLSWGTNDPAFKLEFGTSQPAPIWISNAMAPSLVSGKYMVTNDMIGAFRVYRLKK